MALNHLCPKWCRTWIRLHQSETWVKKEPTRRVCDYPSPERMRKDLWASRYRMTEPAVCQSNWGNSEPEWEARFGFQPYAGFRLDALSRCDRRQYSLVSGKIQIRTRCRYIKCSTASDIYTVRGTNNIITPSIRAHVSGWTVLLFPTSEGTPQGGHSITSNIAFTDGKADYDFVETWPKKVGR